MERNKQGIFHESVIHRCHWSWNGLMGSLMPIYEDIVRSITNHYDLTDVHGYRFTYEEFRVKRIFPRLHDFLRPLRVINVAHVKAVIVFPEPVNNGMATGVPLDYNPVRNAPLPDENIELAANTLTIMAALAEDAMNDHLLYHHDDLNVYKWIKQGVLPMYASITSKQGEELSHLTYWSNFSIEFIRALGSINPGLPVVFLGDIGHTIEHENWQSNITPIYAPDLYFDEIGIADLLDNNPLKKINELFSSKMQDTIQW